MNEVAKIFIALMGIALLAGAVSAGGPAQTLKLVAKDANQGFEPIDKGAWGNLMYKSDKFTFNGHGLEPRVSYTLISYKENWAGDEVILGTAVSSKNGKVQIKGDETTLLYYPYTSGEFAGQTGAKIWLVPTDCMTGADITIWAPDRFLFETSLVV
jgi:hypothetical protein